MPRREVYVDHASGYPLKYFVPDLGTRRGLSFSFSSSSSAAKSSSSSSKSSSSPPPPTVRKSTGEDEGVRMVAFHHVDPLAIVGLGAAAAAAAAAASPADEKSNSDSTPIPNSHSGVPAPQSTTVTQEGCYSIESLPHGGQCSVTLTVKVSLDQGKSNNPSEMLLNSAFLSAVAPLAWAKEAFDDPVRVDCAVSESIVLGMKGSPPPITEQERALLDRSLLHLEGKFARIQNSLSSSPQVELFSRMVVEGGEEEPSYFKGVGKVHTSAYTAFASVWAGARAGRRRSTSRGTGISPGRARACLARGRGWFHRSRGSRGLLCRTGCSKVG